MRLGSIEFINSLPVDLGLLKGITAFQGKIVPGAPAFLNEKILRGELEVSPVSVFWYAQHQSEFLILPDLSISSESGVMSVLLFSRKPISELAGHKISITPKGRTTPALLEILCRMRYGFKPSCHSREGGNQQIGSPTNNFGDDFEGADAFLLIGDEALLAKERLKNSGLYIVDLAEEWRTWTGLPLVFAVWAARREYFETHAEEVFAAHQALLDSKRWGLSHLGEVIEEARSRTHLPIQTLEAYFSKLSYDFDASLQKGLAMYFEKAASCGLLGPAGAFEFIKREPAVTKV